MILDQETRDGIVEEVINAITTQSVSIDTLDTTSDLSETESLPAYRAGSDELVRVPIHLLYDPALEAAASANTAAQAATQATNTATIAADRAVEATDTATEVSNRLNDHLSTLDQLREDTNGLKEQLDGFTLSTLTEKEYDELGEKDDNTLYFCVEE